ncbi:MAG: efflux RND transporter permease subunit [Candidatus Riflebacteria bacterium]|nr:efflux RND transporter permease subunit [Candidatus Riflebacteria bacterium]
MSIPRTSISRPVSVTMLMLGMALIGIGAFFTLNVALFPNIDIPVAFVLAPYAGVDPAEIETIVTKKIEDEINSVENIDKIESYSSEGISQTVINFKFGTDLDLAAVDLRAKVDQAKRELPRDMEQVTVSKVDINSFPVLNIALGGDFDLVELRRIADREIKPAFQQIGGVSNVEIKGGLEREIRVKIFPDRLLAYELTIDDVITAVSKDNQNTPLGNINEGSFKYLLRSEGQVKNPQQLGSIIIKEINRRPVYLSEISNIEDLYKEIESTSRINSQPSVTLEIKKSADANPVLISDAAQRLIPKLVEKYKGRLTITIGNDQTAFIRDTIQMVKDNALMGGLFAIIVLFTFLQNYRSTIIIGTSIPLAIITTFGLLSLKEDISLNLMTLGGLALGIGMMVDNAIVVMENIYRFYADNPSGDRKELAAKASEEVLMPVIASTATTVAVFLPIGFVPAVVGEIFFNMSLAIVFSLLASLVVAITFMPMLCSRFLVLDGPFIETIIVRMYRALFRWLQTHPLKSLSLILALFLLPAIGFFRGLNNQAIIQLLQKTPLAGHEFSPGIDSLLGSAILLLTLTLLPLVVAVFFKIFNFLTARILFPLVDIIIMKVLRTLYLKVLNSLLHHWYLRLGYCALILALFIFSLKMQPAMTFFPAMDRGEVSVEFETPEGTSVEKTDEITRQIEEIFLKIPEVSKVITNSAVGKGTLAIKLTPKKERTKTTNDIVRDARLQVETIAGIRTINYKEPGMGKPSRGKSIQVEVMGDDFTIMEGICMEIYERIKDVEGLKDLESGIKAGRPEFRLVFDREKIRDMGLSLVKIAEMARSHVYGTLAGKYRENNDEYDIRVEAADLSKDKIARIKDLEISLEKGKFVKLSQVAEFRPASGYSTIERKNNARRMIVQADPDKRAIGAITSDITDKIKDIKLPPGYSINFGGENEEMVEAFTYLGIALIASVLLVYMIMASQFESLLYPFLIMFTIPLSYIGVVGGLRVMGFDFSVTAMIGIIMLAGIAVNNGIILIEYILQRRRENSDNDIDAALEAGKLRFRPILMTTFTTLLGMSPLALGIGAGADFYQPLAISVSGGLLVSTLITLTFVPTIFIMAENTLRFVKSFFEGFTR